MNIVQITPGAGGMYCGNCLRDNALVSALRRMGHTALMVPVYLPLTLDEANTSAGTPMFFGGVNVYLDQLFRWYRHAPKWFRAPFDSPALLRWAAGRAAKTKAAQVGDLTISMLQGEEGRQTRELDELVGWLKNLTPKPDVVCLSNALLAGMTRRLKETLQAPVVCMLQGEDSFLDGLPPSHREAAWKTLTQRAGDVNLFIAPSRYYADRMAARLGLAPGRVAVVYNGTSLEGYAPEKSDRDPSASPTLTIGYFARMCPEKGLHLLVEAFIKLKKDPRASQVRLKIGGSCGPGDQPFVDQLKALLAEAGRASDVEFHPNVGRQEKIRFYESLDLLSVPALYGEAFGLYIIEAMAAGVPVVQPRHGAFPELIEMTCGGIVCEPTAEALAAELWQLLSDPPRLRALGTAARAAISRDFSLSRMAENMLGALQRVVGAGRL